MKKSVNSLIGDAIRATDGTIGRVDDLFFDDKTWRISYMVARIGGLLSGKRVLLPPAVLGIPDAGGVPVNYSMEQILNSPGVEFDTRASKPETHLREYFTLGSAGASPLLHGESRDGNSNFLSVRDVVGYRIQATDGILGHAEDFILDDATWSVVHVIAKFLWMRVHVLTNLINHVASAEEKLCLDISMRRIWRSPRVDMSMREAYAG